MDVGIIASALVATLSPILRKLLRIGGEKAAEAIGEKAGEGVLGKIWELIRPKVDAKAGAPEAAREVAENPDDADAREELEMHLKRILAANQELAVEVAKLLEQAKASGVTQTASLHGDGSIAQAAGPGARATAAGKGGVAVGGSVYGSLPRPSGDSEV